MVAGTDILSNAVYDASIDRYIAALDLSTVALGKHGLVATASFYGMSDACTFAADVVSAVSVDIQTDSEVYRTGDTVTVSGTAEGLNIGDSIECHLGIDEAGAFKQ